MDVVGRCVPCSECANNNSLTYECQACLDPASYIDDAWFCAHPTLLVVDVDVYTQEVVPFDRLTKRAFKQAWVDCAAGIVAPRVSDVTNDTNQHPVG